MIKIINYLNEIEQDYKKGHYTVKEYAELRDGVINTILKSNLNKF
jgi:hypothetical protein